MDNNQMTRHWQEICGDAPESFRRRAQSTLYNLRSQSPRRRMKPALAMALGLTLLLGSAFALSQLGLLDSLNPALKKDLLPEASEMVKSNIPQQAKQPALAHFTVEEAIYDGRQVYLTLRVKPANPKESLLMDRNAMPAWAADYVQTGDEMKGESFAEKALAQGQRLVQPSVEEVTVSDKLHFISTQQVSYQEDSLLYILTFPAQGQEARVKLHLRAPDIYKQTGNYALGTLDFTLTKSPQIKAYVAKTPVSLPKSGLVLKECLVENTPIASYLILRYDLAPDATPLQGVNMEDGIWTHWLDDKGQPRESGDSEWGLEKQADGGVALTQSFGALKEAPDEITLSFYNGMRKELFDQITLTLTPKEDK